MKFVDEVRIRVKAGDGGKGCVAFRREKYRPMGGPSGGNGGRGGSVVLVADPQRSTLLDYRYNPLQRAPAGEPGMGDDRYGSDGGDLVLPVPLGTVVHDEDTGEILGDLDHGGQRLVVAAGGRGGMGNMHFATPTKQAPRYAQPGEPGDERNLRLELKLLADVGLVGFPNAGKSTLVSRVSAARPKIADYPFTTLAPSLGMVDHKGRQFVVADIPGLVEGAAEGRGLGHQFLRHVERCRVLIHLIDGAAEGDRDPEGDHRKIREELGRYSERLASKAEILAVNKCDLPDGDAAAELLEEALGRPVRRVSAVSGLGIEGLLDETIARLDEALAAEAAEAAERASADGDDPPGE